MWKKLFTKEKPPEPIKEVPQIKQRPMMGTHYAYQEDMRQKSLERWESIVAEGLKPLQNPKLAMTADSKNVATMDNQLNTKIQSLGGQSIPEQQVFWYASQSFIGFQLCAMLSQQWLVKKCCLMPAKDAVRNGYELTVNDGTDIDPEILDEIRKFDVDYRMDYNLIQFVDMGRVFGIRIAMFIVDSDDEDYYFKPFNPDGVTPGSYKGISQIDPYWITPQLDTEAAGAPASIHFYEPTWWNIAGRLVHRTHLVIFKTEEVPDILKPTYIYAGVSIPQKIYERVYAAERTANEAPLLALTKRLNIIQTDMSQAEMNSPEFFAKIQGWVYTRDNYGIKAVGLEEDIKQLETSLAELDAVIMTQYQLVAAAANVPAEKLMGTTPKGFHSSGEYEEATYHEELESIQTHDLTPLLERHHMLLIRSEICPKYGMEPFETTVVWKPLDAMTAKELAELNKLKAETGAVLSQSGAVDGTDERERVIADPESGYQGLTVEEVSSIPNDTDNDWEAAAMGRQEI